MPGDVYQIQGPVKGLISSMLTCSYADRREIIIICSSCEEQKKTNSK